MPEQLDFEGEFRNALDADPFVPFEIVVASGDRYEVTAPDDVTLGLDVVLIMKALKTIRIRLYNIVSLETREKRS